MAAPLIEAADISATSGFASSWSAPYNAYVSGDLVVFHLASDAALVTHTLPASGPNSEAITTLTNSTSTGSGGATISVWYFVGSATTGSGSQTVTPSGSEAYVATSFVVPAAEFNAATPIEAFATSGSAGSQSTVPSPALSGTNAGGRVVAWLGIDTDTVTGTPTGWTDRDLTAQGQVTGCLSTRDAETTATESIPSYDWTIPSDSSTTAGYVVNGPAGGGPTATPKGVLGLPFNRPLRGSL